MAIQEGGSLGSASDMSAATGFHHLNRKFGSLAFASSNSLSDMSCAQHPPGMGCPPPPFGTAASAPFGAATQLHNMHGAMQTGTYSLSAPGQGPPQQRPFSSG